MPVIRVTPTSSPNQPPRMQPSPKRVKVFSPSLAPSVCPMATPRTNIKDNKSIALSKPPPIDIPPMTIMTIMAVPRYLFILFS